MLRNPAKVRSLAPLLAFGWLAAAGSAQETRPSQAPPPSSDEQIPRFETGVHTVLVDALVLDGKGAPVTDLERSELTVLEDGLEQEITTFDVTDWTSYISAKTSSPTARPVDVEINAYPRRFIFVVNRQGASFTYLTRAKRALREFVIESLADGDEAMLVEIGYSVKVLQEFDSAKEQTLESLKKLSAMVVDYPQGYDRASREAYRALEELGRALLTLPGRKVVVFFSMELQTASLPGSTFSNETGALQAAIEAFNQSNTSVYSIDLRGVDRVFGNFASGLSPLALETGGRFFQNQTSFETPLARVGKENQRYYLLGYSPSRSEMDGSYRKIEVRVDRAGVEVIARQGYFARPPDASLSTEALEADDSAAAKSANRSPSKAPPAGPADNSPVIPRAVEMTTYLMPSGNGVVRVPVTIALPLELLSQGGSEKTLSVILTDDAGDTVERFSEVVDLEHFYVLRNFDLGAGLYLMQITLEAAGKKLYQASTGIQVPNDYGARFGISSILPVVSPENSGAVGDGLPILPTPTVRRGQNAHILFQIFAGRPEPSQRVRLTYKIYKDDREIRTMEHPDGIDLSGSGAGGTPVILSLPTGELTGGVYRVELLIRDETLSRRATSEMELRIE